MSLFTKLFEAVQSWRRRRGALQPRKSASPAMEQLDHRQLMAVNFTGVVANDFSPTQVPNVAVIPAPANNVTPGIPPNLQPLINVSGFQIDQLRVSYDQGTDILSVGVEGPLSGRPDNQQVIAGDADNNGNAGTVNPAVLAVQPGFEDPPDFTGTETYGVLLALKPETIATKMNADVAAGFPIVSPDPTTQTKPYTVALANNDIQTDPDRFVATALLPQYTGGFFLANSPNTPNFELQVKAFSQLYQQITGTPLTSTSTIGVGAFGNSAQTAGISGEFFPPQPITIGTSTVSNPGISVVKTVNGLPQPSVPGPSLTPGSPVIFGYQVTNTGNEPLRNVALADDGGSAFNPGGGGVPFAPTFVSGDNNANGLLDVGETWLYTASAAAQVGQYQNVALAAGIGNISGTNVSDTDLGHYLGVTPVVCPPVSPPIFVNPHLNYHINTAHPSAIRVTILGSSGFDPTTIDPATVLFGNPNTILTDGATPILNFENNVNGDQFPDETFVFNGLDVTLPPGITQAQIIGQAIDPTTGASTPFASQVKVFNRDYSFYTPAEIAKQQQRWQVVDGVAVPPPVNIPKAARERAASQAIDDLYNPFKGQKVPRQANPQSVMAPTPASTRASGTVVSIPTKNNKGVKATKAHSVSVTMNTKKAAATPALMRILGGAN